MKISYQLLCVGLCLLSATHKVLADDLTVGAVTADSLTVNSSATFADIASFGTVYDGPTTQANTFRGMHLSIAQGIGTTEITVPYTVEGHYEDQYITVEDYGYHDVEYYEPTYQYGIIGTNYIEPIYNEFGDQIGGGYYEDVYGDVYTGDALMTRSEWGVIGTHSELASVWIDPYQSSYTDFEFDAPKIRFTATRSDANWAWQVPGEGGDQDVLVVWKGGLRVPSTDPNRMMALASDSLTQSYDTNLETGRLVNVTRLGSQDLKAGSTFTSGSGTALVTEEKSSEVKPEAIVLTYVEKLGAAPSTVTSSSQSQIAARSAHFAGVVTVVGDMKVQGVLRVEPAGNLSMGIYEEGVRPVPQTSGN